MRRLLLSCLLFLSFMVSLIVTPARRRRLLMHPLKRTDTSTVIVGKCLFSSVRHCLRNAACWGNKHTDVSNKRLLAEIMFILCARWMTYEAERSLIGCPAIRMTDWLTA